MKSARFKTFLQEKNAILSALILTLAVIILGGIAEYLVEFDYPGANITNLGDALWWSATRYQLLDMAIILRYRRSGE